MQAESAASRANTRVSLHLHLTGLATARERRAGVCMQPRWWLVEPALPVHAAAAALLALVLLPAVLADAATTGTGATTHASSHFHRRQPLVQADFRWLQPDSGLTKFRKV